MVEVFKTNVHSGLHAKHLVNIIEYHFKNYKVNFDLDDCDRILRVEAPGTVDVNSIITILTDLGVTVEILLDEPFLLIIT